MDSNHSETINLITYKSNDVAYCGSSCQSKKSLKRCLTYSQVFSMIVTSMVGSGLFISPALVAALAPNMGIAIIIWILAGGCALLGSLCYCELASVVRKIGSSYIFVFDCYGECPAFVLLWSNAVVVIPCATSIVAYTAGIYICTPIIADQTSSSFLWYSKLFAVLIILLAIFINCIGVKTTGSFQTILTILYGCIVALIVAFGKSQKNQESPQLKTIGYV